MNTLRPAVLIVLSAALCCGEGRPEKPTFRHVRNTTIADSYVLDDHCTHNGIQCSGCSGLQLCFERTEGYASVHEEDCTADNDPDNPENNKYCSQSERACSKKESYCFYPDESFTCRVEGIYPDPFDCNVFHICVTSLSGGLEVTSHTCGVGLVYNEAMYKCEGKTEENEEKCTGLVIEEPDNVERVGVLENNRNIYYIYSEGRKTPDFYRCLNDDYIFDVEKLVCTEE